MNIKIAPSLMCAEQLSIGKEIEKLTAAGVDLFHIDIMDGHFVDNFGFSFDAVKSIKGITNIPLELHLVIAEPAKYIDKFISLGGDVICFHVEVCEYPLRLIKTIKSFGVKAGVVLNPATPIESYEYLLETLDEIVLLTVEPGFAEQRFIPSVVEKISKTRNMVIKMNLDIDIEVDGNINLENALLSVNAGANVLVCGTSSIFRTKDIVNNLKNFRNNLQREALLG